MAAKPPLRHEEVKRVLRVLAPLTTDRRVVLVGGQAVALWMRFLAGRSEELAFAEPLASKDIDFEGSAKSVRVAAELLGGRMKLTTMDDNTPNTGLVLFDDSDGIERGIDFIDAPLGLKERDVRDTSVQLVLDDGPKPVTIWVMHPERCMESRVINTIQLHKTDPLALRQLEVSIICAKLWSQFILDDESLPEDTRVRAALKINERIFRKCIDDRRFRDVLLDHGADPFDAVLVDDGRLPDRLRDQRYPQMRAQLDDRLKRDRSNRQRRGGA